MNRSLSQRQFEQLWRRLQRLGLTTYEARTYVVLLGHPQFRAVDLASRAKVPKQKIYDVLAQLRDKGFAIVSRGRTKLFSAVPPAQAIPSFLQRQRKAAEQQFLQLEQLGESLIEALQGLVQTPPEPATGLEHLCVIEDPLQAAVTYRELLVQSSKEFREFVCPPYAVTPIETELVAQALERGVRCRLLIDEPTAERLSSSEVNRLIETGAEVRVASRLPLKLAIFDQVRGMCALQDPVVTHPGWTSLLFSHPGMIEAMNAVFEHYWERGSPWRGKADARSRAANANSG